MALTLYGSCNFSPPSPHQTVGLRGCLPKTRMTPTPAKCLSRQLRGTCVVRWSAQFSTPGILLKTMSPRLTFSCDHIPERRDAGPSHPFLEHMLSAALESVLILKETFNPGSRHRPTIPSPGLPALTIPYNSASPEGQSYNVLGRTVSL